DMYACYGRILTRLGLTFRAVLADTGSIGGEASHEFHVLANTGEDVIAYTEASDYAANIEQAICLPPSNPAPAPTLPLSKVETPNIGTIDALCHFLNVPATQTLKTLIVEASDACETALVALVLRGDHELNTIKAEKHPWVATPLVMASEAMVETTLGARVGSIGPLNLPLQTLYDHAVLDRSDFVIGATQTDHHFTGCNWERDLPTPATTFDLRTIQVGDASPDGHGTVAFTRGIEVGHIFQLGTKYSEAMKARVLNEQGKAQTLTMGCYGLGISRLVAAAIEQNHDQQGIRWPDAIAPFNVCIVPMNMHKSPRVQQTTQRLYEVLQQHVDVLYDDRKERPGIMLNDMELIGIPYLIIVGDRSLDQGLIELKNRHTQEKSAMTVDQVIQFFSSSAAR
ncbi:MAG: proline--tRNA ligase, partial [Shewanellaceae bacterium]|nr:proline--tRNA ligase [Shewanellaceae bacterium]